MKKKINILIVASLVATLILSGIQYYLMNNTYQLKKESFVKEAHKHVNFLNLNERIDVWNDAYLERLRQLVKEYQEQKITKKDVLLNFKKSLDSANKRFTPYYKEQLNKKELSYHIEYQEEISNIVFLNEKEFDTIFKTNDNEGILLYGKSLPYNKRISINTGRWQSESNSIDDEKELDATITNIVLTIETERFIYIPDWEKIVIKRMLLLLILAIISIITVIGLFVYALKSYIKQKKITDIKTDFINNMSHEFNTPLAVLNIATKTLQQEKVVQGTKEYIHTIETIDRQNIRLQKLLQQVVNNAVGIDASNLNKEAIILENYLQIIVKDFKLKNDVIDIKESYISIESQIQLDKFYINTVVTNVLNNAVKYGGKHIEIKTNVIDGYFIIEIEDDGIGIPRKKQKLIFDKFYRIDSGDIHNTKGLGLGLYYVQEIMKAHGGMVNVKSTLDVGTSIILKLPI